jgi:cytochrome c556
MKKTILLLLGVVTAWALGEARAQAPSFDIIETRQAGQDLLAAAFTGINQAAMNKLNTKRFVDPAAAIARWMKQFPSTFPAGSDHSPSKALPAVWSDRAEFEQRAVSLMEAAEKLAAIAKTGKQSAFAAQVKVVGDGCTACHRQFRAK